MDRKVDIHKAAGVLIQDRKLLITRSKGKDFFVAPGGKLEMGESARGALKRELQEELNISIDAVALEDLGTFYALATGHTDTYLQMDVFIVPEWEGEITPAAEVEEIMWVGAEVPASITLGSIFHHDVLPRLVAMELVD